jgi:S1-C subfamily serine protease
VRHVSWVMVLTACLAGLAPVRAQSLEERTAARDVLSRRSDAIVTVLATLKAHMSQAGRDRPAPDQAVQASATVLDPSGLAVMALSTIDPGNLMARNPALSAAKLSLETELSDVKLRLADGSEVAAKVVLRDSDLDLLFVRPAVPPDKPLAAVDSASPVFAAIDPVVIVHRLQEAANWKAAAGFGTIQVVVEKPRRFYMLQTNAAANGLGGAIFNSKGEFGGIVAMRQSDDARHNALNGMQGGMLQTLGMITVVIPAADIREIAKQAK